VSFTVLELFAGIGGCAAALGEGASVIAVDHDEAAALTYAATHGHSVIRHNLHYAKPQWFERFGADLWWLSPPCQPYTIRGQQRDLQDRRSQALQRVVAALEVVGPPFVAVENVPWFEGSDSEALLLRTLDRMGYAVATKQLCPTALGVPAERRRYYLVASLRGLRAPPERPPGPRGRIGDWLDPFDEALAVPAELASRYDGALHVVDADDLLATAACFTGAYHRSPVYAGSYLRQDGRLRWWSPTEVARSLGFGDAVRFPDAVGLAKRYKLVGNSLSVWAVRQVLARLPV